MNKLIKLHRADGPFPFLINPARIVAVIPRTEGDGGSFICLGWYGDKNFAVTETVEEIEALLI